MRNADVQPTAIRAALLQEHLFSEDIHIKIQILEFAQMFSDGQGLLEQSRAPAAAELSQGFQRTTDGAKCPVTETRRRSSPRYSPPRDDEPYTSNGCPQALDKSCNLLDKYITLCHVSKNKLPEGHADIATKLVMQAASNECRTIGNGSRHGYRECVHRVIEHLRKNSDPGKSQANTEYLSYIRLPIDPPPDAMREARQRKSRENGIVSAVHGFLTNLMKTLDPPILLQLERGKVGGLSREETQKLKEKVGF